MIDEGLFRNSCCPDNGRPNKAVQIVVAVLLLKEMFDLTNEEALGALTYDLRWHVALKASWYEPAARAFRSPAYPDITLRRGQEESGGAVRIRE
jgi:hypothetical protein